MARNRIVIFFFYVSTSVSVFHKFYRSDFHVTFVQDVAFRQPFLIHIFGGIQVCWDQQVYKALSIYPCWGLRVKHEMTIASLWFCDYGMEQLAAEGISRRMGHFFPLFLYWNFSPDRSMIQEQVHYYHAAIWELSSSLCWLWELKTFSGLQKQAVSAFLGICESGWVSQKLSLVVSEEKPMPASLVDGPDFFLRLEMISMYIYNTYIYL